MAWLRSIEGRRLSSHNSCDVVTRALPVLQLQVLQQQKTQNLHGLQPDQPTRWIRPRVGRIYNTGCRLSFSVSRIRVLSFVAFAVQPSRVAIFSLFSPSVSLP